MLSHGQELCYLKLHQLLSLTQGVFVMANDIISTYREKSPSH